MTVPVSCRPMSAVLPIMTLESRLFGQLPLIHAGPAAKGTEREKGFVLPLDWSDVL